MGWSSADGGAGRLGGAPAVPRAGVKRFRAGAGSLNELMSACRSGNCSQHMPAKAPHALRGAVVARDAVLAAERLGRIGITRKPAELQSLRGAVAQYD